MLVLSVVGRTIRQSMARSDSSRFHASNRISRASSRFTSADWVGAGGSPDPLAASCSGPVSEGTGHFPGSSVQSDSIRRAVSSRCRWRSASGMSHSGSSALLSRAISEK